MLNCKDCIKNDVCSKKLEVNKLWENMQLNHDFQMIINSGSTIDICCSNFSEKVPTIYPKGGN